MTDSRPPYLHAAGAALGAFLVYVWTLAPTTWFWDTSEYIATAHILGIPHPPGNPLFVVIGRVWSLLLAPTGLEVAARINLLAALTSALATGFFFLVTWRILRGWLEVEDGKRPPSGQGLAAQLTRRMPLVGAWLGALMGATAFTVWNQSNVNEKVYTLSVLGIAAASWLAIRWHDRRDHPGSGWLLVAAVYVMVLGSTNHLMALLPAPAIGLLVLTVKPRTLLDPKILTRSGLAVVLALSFNFFLPIRSAQDPVINEGEPVCESLGGAAVAIYTNGRLGCEALAANLTREQYQKPSVLADPTSDFTNPSPRTAGLLAHQLLNYFQYFDWQWARGLSDSEVPGNRRLPVTLLFLGLGVWGLVVSVRSGRGPGVFMGTLAVTLSVALVFYLNFKYGYSLDALTPEGIDRSMREVRERDYFFIGSFHLWGFLAGMGLVAAWRWAAGGGRPESRPRHLALASPLLAVAFIPLVFNFAWADRSDDYSARDWAYNMLQSVEPYGILFTNGDNDTFPLWYLQEVEEVRQDVTVIVVQYLYTEWYLSQLRRHTAPGRQRPFRPDDEVGVYPPPPEPPSRAITSLTDEEMSQVRSGRLGQDFTVPLGDTALQYSAGTWLGRGDRLALAVIRDSLGDRPIHFASTGGLPQTLGLNRWSVRQGLASRLRMDASAEDEGIVQVSAQLGGDLVAVDTTLTLVQDVFSYRGLEERDIWTDRSTLNIPWHFYFLFFQLAEAAETTERSEELVWELGSRAESFLATAQGGHAVAR